MKATGIVRRIDDLGRVVIPKEIRRTMRIREGDPLEIYTERDGEVIFKKYSPIGELSNYASVFADTVSKNCSRDIIIADKDTVVSASHGLRKEVIDKTISEQISHYIENRRHYIYKKGDQIKIPILSDNNKYFASVIVPIIADSDTVGCVILAMSEAGEVADEGLITLINTTAQIIGKQLEG